MKIVLARARLPAGWTRSIASIVKIGKSGLYASVGIGVVTYGPLPILTELVVEREKMGGRVGGWRVEVQKFAEVQGPRI